MSGGCGGLGIPAQERGWQEMRKWSGKLITEREIERDKERVREREPNLCWWLIHSLLRISHLNTADITEVQMGGRGLVAHMYTPLNHTVLNHTPWSKAFEAAAVAQCVGRGRGERGEEKTPNTIATFVWWIRRLMIWNDWGIGVNRTHQHN